MADLTGEPEFVATDIEFGHRQDVIHQFEHMLPGCQNVSGVTAIGRLNLKICRGQLTGR